MKLSIHSISSGRRLCLGFNITNTKLHGSTWYPSWSLKPKLVRVKQLCNWQWSKDKKRKRFTSAKRCSIWSCHFYGLKNWSLVKCQRYSRPRGITGSTKRLMGQGWDWKTYQRGMSIILKSCWLTFSWTSKRVCKILTMCSKMMASVIGEWVTLWNSLIVCSCITM